MFAGITRSPHPDEATSTAGFVGRLRRRGSITNSAGTHRQKQVERLHPRTCGLFARSHAERAGGGWYAQGTSGRITAMTPDRLRELIKPFENDVNIVSREPFRTREDALMEMVVFLAQRELERMEREPGEYVRLNPPVIVETRCSVCKKHVNVCCFSNSALAQARRQKCCGIPCAITERLEKAVEVAEGVNH